MIMMTMTTVMVIGVTMIPMAVVVAMVVVSVGMLVAVRCAHATPLRRRRS
jgi:hypothetical protein